MSSRIFSTGKDGKLSFVGDFENLYLEDDDPWEQSGKGKSDEMRLFYQLSRKQLIEVVAKYTKPGSIICEIGCGSGHVTNLLHDHFSNCSVSGCDISTSAIHQAHLKFQNLSFFHHDILEKPLDISADIIILSNMLWYVLHDLTTLAGNCFKSLGKGSLPKSIIVYQALFKEHQRYGVEVINSVGTFVDVLSEKFSAASNKNKQKRINIQQLEKK